MTNLSDPPVTWVGARYRHVVRELDGNKAMVKITTIPKGARSRCWFGPSDLSDYTIQADVRGSISDNKMPDIGLIAQGYTLDLQGAAQELQIRSWSPMLRMAKTIGFPWKPDTWYVMKLRAENQDGQAVLHGKVWPRDQEEPAEWTIEAVDRVAERDRESRPVWQRQRRRNHARQHQGILQQQLKLVTHSQKPDGHVDAP